MTKEDKEIGKLSKDLLGEDAWNDTFEYEYLQTIEDVHQQIKKCEGVHSQQVCFSTFHDALTQVCFGCKKIRSNIRR